MAVLLDALDGVALFASERASLTWLAGFEVHTVENVRRGDHPRPAAEVSNLPTTDDLAESGSRPAVFLRSASVFPQLGSPSIRWGPW